MWPIPTLCNEIVTISFSPSNLVLSWIYQEKHGTPAIVKAYQRTPLEHHELEKLILFNPTQIKQLITTFLSRYHLSNAFIACSFSGPSIMQDFVSFSTSTPTKEQFNIQHSSNMLWHYQYVYHNENGQFIFYVYKVAQSVLLQYKLLAIATKTNVVTFTTETIALLHCYKHILGTNFRQSQLALDMIQHNNNAHAIIPTDVLRTKITVPPGISLEQELPHIAISYGLFINQRILS